MRKHYLLLAGILSLSAAFGQVVSGNQQQGSISGTSKLKNAPTKTIVGNTPTQNNPPERNKGIGQHSCKSHNLTKNTTKVSVCGMSSMRIIIKKLQRSNLLQVLRPLE